jgi:uncharacterized protein (DUF427 family)
MAVSMERQMWSALDQVRFQPTPKRVRVGAGDEVVSDTTRALLVWEPRRVVPSYAVPMADVAATLQAAGDAPAPDHEPLSFGPDWPTVLDPSIPFAVHTAPGDQLDVVSDDGTRPAAAFRLTDPDLGDHVVLDFEAFDWWEEDEPIVSHPRDPFHRIDVRRSSRPVRLGHDGHVLAESTRCRMLFEGAFPLVRYYMPRDDVRVELRESDHRTTCAYKGQATHYSATVGDRELDAIAWSYEDPLDDAMPVRSLVCFYQERLDLAVDGQAVERIRTPWS